MPFINYLARHSLPLQNDITHKHHTNKRSQTLPTVIKKKKEIGDYILCRTIGRGASGRVKLGIHKQTGEKVAIKMISRSHLIASSTTSKSVQRELAVLQLLHHPNLVDLRQVLQDSQYVYFVMEYLEGGELFHVLAERGRLREPEARHLFTQLIAALTWCHAHRISHRDLKPENILLDKEKKNLKIVDFGMAAMQPSNTLLKTSCGSPHYASPEIVRGKKYDGTATDVWSCGALLYAMMTGHLPFDDEHMGRLLAKIKTGRYRSLPDYLSADAKDLIQRMLVVDPTKRMTVAEILCHPWLTNKFFLGTDVRFLQQSGIVPKTSAHSTGFIEAELTDPLSDPQLEFPMINSPSDLDGRIWETLKVLWRDKTEAEILNSLTTQGSNVQKLTCKLLQERSRRLEQQTISSPLGNHSSVSLPLRRSSVIVDDVLMTPPLRSHRQGNDDVESYMLSAPSSMDIMCCKTLELPPTPKSTTTFVMDSTITMNTTDHNSDFYSTMILEQQQNVNTKYNNSSRAASGYWVSTNDDGGFYLQQTEDIRRGSKADAADLFVMTKPVESTCIITSTLHNDSATILLKNKNAWWLCVKQQDTISQQEEKKQELNWWNKTCSYLFSNNQHKQSTKQEKKVVTIECFSKHEYETAGKLHQVLEECYQGKLAGRMYPHGKIVWNGSMKIKHLSPISFICHMSKPSKDTDEDKIQIDFIIPKLSLHHDIDLYMNDLLDCLNKYELESDWVTKTNGWIHPEIIF